MSSTGRYGDEQPTNTADEASRSIESGYDPEFEWPGSTSETGLAENVGDINQGRPNAAFTAGVNDSSFLRLVVKSTSILPSHHRVAAITSFDEVSIGRDRTATPRIRLKEMAVSKYHANIFWDKERLEWAIVDMGSVHGTFVIAASEASSSVDTPVATHRLSNPRVASVPRALHHLDSITIGGTTLVCHMHADGRPCEDCSLEAGTEISLVSDEVSSNSNKKRKRTEEGPPPPMPKDPRAALASLKSSLLASARASPKEQPTVYTDRAAARRALYKEPLPLPGPSLASAPSLPPLPLRRPPRMRSLDDAISLRQSPVATPSPTPPPAPLSSDNVGHRLLLMQGWNPGTGLGSSEEGGLIEPLTLASTSGRGGLGSAAYTKRTEGGS